MGILSSLFGYGEKNKKSNKNTDGINIPMTKPVENISATDDQKERRAASEKICISEGIPIYKNPNSLFVAPEKEVTLRTKNKVVDRTFALLYLGLKSEGLEQVHLDRINAEFDIAAKLSTLEKEYVLAASPTQQQKTNANWGYESLQVLLWSLGYIDELVYPNKMCTVADDVKIIYELGPDKFRAQANLRTKKEILDQADSILRFNWACVNARVKNENAPGALNPSVVYQRHYALNWLIKAMNQDWDNVSTDT